MDRRLTPSNGRVAAMHLAGQVDADRYLEGWPMRVVAEVADLRASPNGARDRQLLLGAAVTVFERHVGWAFVQAVDGYVGYVEETDLADPLDPTHFCCNDCDPCICARRPEITGSAQFAIWCACHCRGRAAQVF